MIDRQSPVVTDVPTLIRQRETLKELCNVYADKEKEQRFIIARLSGDLAKSNSMLENTAALMGEMVDAIRAATEFLTENKDKIQDIIGYDDEWDELYKRIAIIEEVHD